MSRPNDTIQTKISPALAPENALHLARLEEIATWMDRRFLDPILGFVFPGAGDTLCSLVGVYGVVVALQMKVHPVVITRMLLNLALDSFVGGFPILGALFDIFYRAHVRNLDLIKSRTPAGEAQTSDWVVVLAAAFVLLVALLLPILIVGALIALAIHLV
jgi:hypothetical protein